MSQDTKKILNFGSLNIDNVYRVDKFVSPGETKLATDFQRFIGGKGNNQTVAIARAGGNVCHAGCIGTDGAHILEALQHENVDISHIKIVDTPTGRANIQVDDAGENCITLFGGANQEVTKEDIDTVLSDFNESNLILLQNEISEVDYLIYSAKEKGFKVIFNPAPITPGIKNYALDLIDVFIVNQVEGQMLTGGVTTEEILQGMRKLYPNSVVILTLGQGGAIYQDRSRQIKQDAFKVHAVDSTGAGDTFLGYFITEILKNDFENFSDLSDEVLKRALERACFAASKCVTRPGAASSIPSVSEIN